MSDTSRYAAFEPEDSNWATGLSVTALQGLGQINAVRRQSQVAAG